jgi:hypothetical protein
MQQLSGRSSIKSVSDLDESPDELRRALRMQRSLPVRQAVITVLAAAATIALPCIAINAQQVTATREEAPKEEEAKVEEAKVEETKAEEAPVEEVAATANQAKDEPAATGDDVTKLSDMTVNEDPLRALSNDPSASSFGFSKPLLETPRTVSFVSEEQIRLFGISTVEDLSRVVSGTFTTTRYGLQGGVQVRGVASDYYFRGMKRLSMQGHARTVLSAMDNIEVVKGPPSPIFGMGKIGGFINLDPKSSRARTGKYLSDTNGFAQGIVGSYDRTEMSFGAGGPFSIMDKTGGYYLYALLEKSNSYIEQVGITQRFVQTTASVDNFMGPFRLDIGGQAQQSITSGAYLNRLTQDLVDNGTYITGMPLVNLDVNGDGAIGFRERNINSPVVGAMSTANQALTQRLNWPTDTLGNPLPFGQWPSITGVPQSMLSYLAANPTAANACPAAAYIATLPAAPVGGQYARQLPAGFALDPCTVGTTAVNYRRNGSFEREQNAKQMLLYLDLTYDTNPDFTIKNQIFYDYLDSFKDSYLPYGENQSIHAFEDKITVTTRIPDNALPEWLRVNTLASVNYRRTAAKIKSSGGDFDLRQDIMYREGHLVPNTSFWTQLNYPSVTYGALPTRRSDSVFDEKGVGVMFDIDIFRKTNLLLGGRYDKSHAEAHERPDFIETTGTNALPGQECAVTPGGVCAAAQLSGDDSDQGTSWSVSISHQLPWAGIRPYATFANSSLTLDGANNLLTPAVVNAPAGHIGEAELKEVGFKTSMFNNKLQFTAAAYEQSRTDVATPDDPTAGAEVSSSIFRGIEADFKWSPTHDLYLGMFGLWQEGKYTVASSGTIDLTARQAGFKDVLEPTTGKVIYPAEAFFYGGRVQVVLPAAIAAQYMDRTGLPGRQLGLTSNYVIGHGFGLLLNGQYFSANWADRLKTIRLPEAYVWNGGATWDSGAWHLKFNGYNVLDRRYFRGRLGDTGLGVVSAMPTARWEFTVKVDF